MDVISPIANFIEVLKQVIQTAQTHGAKLKFNEASTRAALVDPILKALGWDPTNPDMIEFEKMYAKSRLDYALLDCYGNVVAIVEAKALGGDISSPAVTSQILSYGFSFSLPNIFLTDGLNWHYYSNAIPGSSGLESFDLSQDNLITCADFFLKKLDASRYWLQSVPSKKPTASTAQPVPTVPVQSTSTPPQLFQTLTSLPKNLKNHPLPKSLCLPDGNVIPIHHWKDILVECVKFTLQTNPAIPIPLPDRSGKTVSLLDSAKPTKNVSITQFPYNGKTVYVYLNYDSMGCVDNAAYILGFLPKGKVWPEASVAF